MEAGDLPLDAALKSFEEGIRLIRLCSAKLEESERRVEELLARDAAPATQPFQDDTDGTT